MVIGGGGGDDQAFIQGELKTREKKLAQKPIEKRKGNL